jgi:RND family efflux transporter MFP subunit
MRKNRKYFIIAGIVILLAAIAAVRIITNQSTGDMRRQNATLVKVELPKRETVVYTLQFNGDVIAIQQANIFSKVSGAIERIYADIGAEVRRNQILATIDSTELYQQVQMTSATHSNARVTYRRTKELFEQNLVAQQDLDNAEAAMKVASANYDNARTRLSYARITAPFAGIITKRYLDAGALVNANNATLFTLMDLDNVKISVNVLEKDIALIVAGKKAAVTVDAYPGKTYEGTITRSSQAIDPATRTMAVEIVIPNGDHSLKPGMFASVILKIDEHPDALTIPTPAVLRDGRGQYVYISDNSIAKRIPVVVGTEQGPRLEILSGLVGTEQVITTGQQMVKDGGPIIIQK